MNMVPWYRLVGQVCSGCCTLVCSKWALVVRGGHSPPRFHAVFGCLSAPGGTEQARLVKTVKVQCWVAQAHLDQTVGCNTREGGSCLVQGCDRYRLGHRPVFSFCLRRLNVQSGPREGSTCQVIKSVAPCDQGI